METTRMKLLAVDTSTNVCSLCITDEQDVVAEYASISGRTHTERLLPAIDMLFSHLDWDIRDLRGIAVIHGPGSFTGLRISLSAVKGLSYALQIPVVAFNALEVAANQIKAPGLICPAMDARRREIFTALYERKGNKVIELIPPRSITPEAWRASLPDEAVQFCGAGAQLYFDQLKNHPETLCVFTEFILARTLAQLAFPLFLNGQYMNGSDLRAAYLRPSDAETKGPRPTKRITVHS